MDGLNERQARLRQVGIGGEEGRKLGDNFLKEAATRGFNVGVVARLHGVHFAHHRQRYSEKIFKELLESNQEVSLGDRHWNRKERLRRPKGVVTQGLHHEGDDSSGTQNRIDT